MKTKDLLQILVAVVIFAVAGFLIFTVALPKKASSSKGVAVEKITKIPSSFDSTSMDKLSDSTKIKDFYNQPNLSSLGNSQPFGPLR